MNKILIKNLSFTQNSMSKYFQFWFKNSTPVFMYAPLETELKKLNQAAGEDDGIDLISDINARNIKDLGNGQTMLFGFNIDNIPKDKDFVSIASHSGNNCWQFIINDIKSKDKSPTFQFRKSGSPGMSSTFYTKQTPLADRTQHIALTQFGGKMKLFMNGREIIKADKLDFSNFNCPAGLILGNDNNNHPFSGTIYYAVIFKEIMSNDNIKHFHSTVNKTILLPKNGNMPLGVLTSDGRPCVMNPVKGPTPGMPGAPEEPNQDGSSGEEPLMDPSNDDDDYGSSSSKSKPSDDKDAKYSTTGGKGSKYNESNTEEEEMRNLEKDNSSLANEMENGVGASSGSDKATCLMKGESQYPNDGEGKVITDAGDFSATGMKISCPAKCLELVEDTGLNIFGPSVNTDDKSVRIYSLASSICGAAIHSGVITNEEGGDIMFHLTKGRDEYIGVNQNNIQSKSSGSTTVAFYMNGAPLPMNFKCDTLAADKLKTEAGSRTHIRCPQKCYTEYRNKQYSLYGNNHQGYTMDSAICIAAVHAGVLSDDSIGDVSIEVIERDDKYECSPSAEINCVNNGFESKTKKAKFGFKFVESAHSCKYFRETISGPPMFVKYKRIEGARDWKISNKNNRMIIQSDFTDPEKNAIVRNKFDCGNAEIVVKLGITKFNNDDEQFGVIFRYFKTDTDEEQQLAKIFKSNIILYKVINSVESELSRNDYKFGLVDKNNLGIYLLKIKYNFDKISISVRKEPTLDDLKLIEIKNTDIHRGSVGLTKKGSPEFSINQFEVRGVQEKQVKEKFNVLSELNRIDFNQMESFCKSKYQVIKNVSAEEMCKSPFGYCKMNCQHLSFYQRHNTSCIIECLNKQEQFKLLKESMKGKFKDVCSGPQGTFSKIDYNPVETCDGKKNNGTQYAGYIQKSAPEGDLCSFEIVYTCELDGMYKLKTVTETNRSKIEECGVKIDSRKQLSPRTSQNPNRTPQCKIQLTEPKDMTDETKIQSFLKTM